MIHENSECRATGPARATITGQPLAETELRGIDRFWRACNYLAAGMIYLRDNPLLARPLVVADIKKRLLGHWGSSPGLSFLYIHANRLIRNLDQEMLFLAGPGHGAPGVIAPVWLEGAYGEVHTSCGQGPGGMLNLFRQFSFPGGVGSHCTPELPGSIHEGGELGYVLSHAYGAVLDLPGMIALAVVGDGEAETGPLATSWHSNKFINPLRDGAVLPVLHLNGYKISNPSLLARLAADELQDLFRGYGYEPLLVEGSDPDSMHQAMAATMDYCVGRIREIWLEARKTGQAVRPRWPMIILRSPKGWTGPRQVDGHQVEGTWRSHQVPIGQVTDSPAHLKLLEDWLLSYRPQDLFTPEGRPMADLLQLAPCATKRMGANPRANGGSLRVPLDLPDWQTRALPVLKPASIYARSTERLGLWLRDIMAINGDRFRVFGPDETASNKLADLYQVTGKAWMASRLAEDDDGGHLSPDGRVMEMLSEHTLEGSLEGYLLTGRHGLLSTYEAFAHVIDSMVSQHAKWLAKSRELPWRTPVASLNLLITSTVWRQDHNGFTHQDPGFLDVVANKSADVVRIYLPPDANCLLSVANHCLRSVNQVNIIVCDKQRHLQYLSADQAADHCEKGLGIWPFASNDGGTQPDAVVACCGDVASREALAAVALLRELCPEARLRFVNVVDPFRLSSPEFHPHGLTDADYASLFPNNTPVIFNFHGFPHFIHRLTYRRANHADFHVHGYSERGNINTPIELAILNQVDRFSLAMQVIRRVPRLLASSGQALEKLGNLRQDVIDHAHEYGIDAAERAYWTWPAN
ncbi:MAG: phosphoketolase family protein [Planctomycetota bacterium]|nr:MAG: phosphoketolase family protein [Planctomycetota bacterium]